MWKAYIGFGHKWEVKSDPQLEIIAEETPGNCITSRVITFANSVVVMSDQQGIQCHILENLSTTTRIALYVPPYGTLLGKPVIKSMINISYTFARIDRG